MNLELEPSVHSDAKLLFCSDLWNRMTDASHAHDEKIVAKVLEMQTKADSSVRKLMAVVKRHA